MEQKAAFEGKIKEEADLLSADANALINGNGNSTTTNGEASTSNGNGHIASSVRDKSVDTESNNGPLRPPTGSDIGKDDEDVDQLDDDQEEDDEEQDEIIEEEVVEEEEEEAFEDNDEDMSEDGGEATTGGIVGSSGVLGARRQALENKKAEKKAADAARTIELAKAKSEAKAKSVGKKQSDKIKFEIEEGLKQVNKKDEFVEREFRRYFGVARSVPLGKDRFFNRYWWFDGVGGMQLVGPNNSIQYGTGRLFVQGPTQEDWDSACSREGGKEGMEEKRTKEDVDPLATLEVDEWAFYENEEQVSFKLIHSFSPSFLLFFDFQLNFFFFFQDRWVTILVEF